MKTLMVAGKKVLIPILVNGTWYYFYARCNIFNQYWSIWFFREDYPIFHYTCFHSDFFYALYVTVKYKGGR